jgi:hypothetical protein
MKRSEELLREVEEAAQKNLHDEVISICTRGLTQDDLIVPAKLLFHSYRANAYKWKGFYDEAIRDVHSELALIQSPGYRASVGDQNYRFGIESCHRKLSEIDDVAKWEQGKSEKKNWLRRFFRKKGAQKKDEYIANEFMEKSEIDLRPAGERRMESEARSDLVGEDEQYAQQLCHLLLKSDLSSRTSARTIGEELYANGGHQRMVRVCLRVKALGGKASTLERYIWDGIGEWKG